MFRDPGAESKQPNHLCEFACGSTSTCRQADVRTLSAGVWVSFVRIFVLDGFRTSPTPSQQRTWSSSKRTAPCIDLENIKMSSANRRSNKRKVCHPKNPRHNRLLAYHSAMANHNTAQNKRGLKTCDRKTHSCRTPPLMFKVLLQHVSPCTTTPC